MIAKKAYSMVENIPMTQLTHGQGVEKVFLLHRMCESSRDLEWYESHQFCAQIIDEAQTFAVFFGNDVGGHAVLIIDIEELEREEPVAGNDLYRPPYLT